MATYYISPSGNDTTGDGSSGNPWLTISKFNSSSAVNDTLVCKNGTYAIASFAAVANRIVQAETNGQVIFDRAGTALAYTFTGTNTITGLVLENFRGTAGGSGALHVNSGTTTFANCTFYKFIADTRGAVDATNSGSILNFVNCLFDDMLAVSGGSGQAFYNNQNSGVITLTHCTLSIRTTGASQLTHLFMNISGGSISKTLTNVIIRNSTGATVSWGNTTASTITYSDLYLISSSPSLGTGCITSDPLFVDETNSIFKLRPNSPCLDVGTLI